MTDEKKLTQEAVLLTGEQVAALDLLMKKWKHLVRRKFFDAEREQTLMGRRFIEHGAMCYFSCWQDLKEVLQPSTPVISPAPLEPQT